MPTHPATIRAHHTCTTPGVHVFIVRSPHVSLTIDLTVPGADAQIYGVYRGDATDTYTLTITHHHHAPDTASACIIRAVLDGSASLTLHNTLHIAAGAATSTATADIRALLLSDTARATVTPHMDVIPADVHCTHAATITPLSATRRNYLHARGITDTRATNMLSAAFTADLEHRIAQSPRAIVI